MRRLFSIFSCVCLGFVQYITAQDLGNSPYSQIGIGDILNTTAAHQQGMGATGVSYSLPFLINPQNAAMQSRLSKTKRTMYEAGFITQLKELRQGDLTQRDFGGSLSHLAIAMPVSNRMGAALSLQPYSSVSYNNSFRDRVENSDFQYDKIYRGSGGLSALSLALGYDFTGSFRPDTLRHRFGVGLRVNYLFGSIIDEVIVTLRSNLGNNTLDSYETAQYKRTGYSDATFEPSFLYSYRWKKEYLFNVGGVYAIGKQLNSRRFESLDIRRNDVVITSDTLLREARGNVSLPDRFTLGLSLEREYRWALALDVSTQNWANFREDFDRVNPIGRVFGYDRKWTVALGGQWIPDFASIRPGFWRRSAFRAGLQFTNTPVNVRGTAVRDLSVSVGASIPLLNFSLLNFSVVGGQRGTAADGLIQERYYRFNFGITINDRWFIRPKYN